MEAKQTELNRLLVGTKTFVIPQFQRHYKWKRPQWAELFEDILEQYYEPDVQSGAMQANEGHFLGSIVLHPTPGPASTVAQYWVIDGQQRLITLLTLIAALRDFRKQCQEDWDSAEYDDQYLTNRFSRDRPRRLVPGENDREDFEQTIFEGNPSGLVGDAYEYFTERLIELDAEDNIDFETLHNAILLRLLLVEINTSKEDNINQIFHTLNHAGTKLSAVDLIRNHAFMQIPSNQSENAYREYWKPLEEKFDKESELARYLWAQLVREEPKVTQKDLYQPFADLIQRNTINGDTEEATKKLLQRFKLEAEIYKAMENPAEARGGHWSPQLFEVVEDLAMWGSKPSRPLTLDILCRLENRFITDSDAAEALRYLLSLLVRRSLCSIPTNNLNRQLSGIPSRLRPGSVAPQILSELSQESKYWPNDNDVLTKIQSTSIYVTAEKSQVKLILMSLNRKLNPTEQVNQENLTIEHIMPKTLTEDWTAYITNANERVEVALAKRHVLGNLTLTGDNSSLARRLIAGKVEIFSESNLPLNRLFEHQDSWLPADIDARSYKLAQMAIDIWPKPKSPSTASDEGSNGATGINQFTVKAAIESIPADKWTSVSSISELTGLQEAEVEAGICRLEYKVFDSANKTRIVSGDRLAEIPPTDPELLTSHEIADYIQSVGSDVFK